MKRFLVSLLALCMLSLSIALPAAAQDNTSITGLSGTFGSANILVNGMADRDLTIWDLEFLRQLDPGTSLFLPLSSSDFVWSHGTGTVTADTIGRLGLSVAVTGSDGTELLQRAGLATLNGRPGLEIVFTSDFPTFDPKEFYFTVKLLVNGQPQIGAIIPVQGTMANRGVSVKGGDTKVTLGPGRFAVGYADVQNVRFNIGSNVTIVSNIALDQKYYGAALEQASDVDKVVMQQYPQIKKVIKVTVINLDGRVEFNIPDTNQMYVYDSGMNYLGTTQDSVVLRSSYYLTSSPI